MARRGKKKKIWKKILLGFLLILIVAAGVVVGMLYGKFSNVKIKHVDKNNLGINDDLYAQISGELTENEFKNIRNFVLFGVDTQSTGDGQDDDGFVGRTDTIIIVSVNPKYKSIKLISIPRDTYVEIEGHGKTKINHAYAYGEAQLALKTINETFKLNISEYATIDFSGLVNVINDLGGIEVYITDEERNYINRYSPSVYMVSGNDYNYLSSYGNVTLDGEQAVMHARNRDIGDGDFTRAQRQRTVMEAIFAKISKMDATEIYNWMDVFLKEITTNIDVPSYMGLLGEIVINKNSYLSNIVSTQIPKEDYAISDTIDGLYYFVPTDIDAMRKDMWDYMYKR